MPGPLFADVRLVNGSTGDPVLFVSFPGRQSALLFDGGDNGPLSLDQLEEVEALFLTHHHVDHFIGLDRLVRANFLSSRTLSVFGPEGTIRRIHQRLSAYVYPRFDSAKLVLRVYDLSPGKAVWADLACEKEFAPTAPQEISLAWPRIYANDDVEVEACFTDHTIPGLAYALVEKPGYHPDPRKLQNGLLRPGKWVAEALGRLRARAKMAEMILIDGIQMPLGWLKDRFFGRSAGARIAFIVDTFYSERVGPDLVQLARKARRLYCDSYYSSAHAKQAGIHRHMLAAQAGELARLAEVEDLVLVHFSPRYAGRYHTLIEEARASFPQARAELHRSGGTGHERAFD
ncbi:MAG: MBL fold metallo-hydrolase [Gemmataceae bacterium]